MEKPIWNNISCDAKKALTVNVTPISIATRFHGIINSFFAFPFFMEYTAKQINTKKAKETMLENPLPELAYDVRINIFACITNHL